MPHPHTTAPRRNRGRDDPFSEVETAQGFLREGVEGFGEQLRPGLLREIGTTLGGLNEIGALRSGAVPVELGNISGRYGEAVGAFAKQATTAGLGHGLEAGRQRFAREEARRRRRGSLLRSVGMALGTAAGFIVGGPPGAAAGAGVGGSLFDDREG